MMTFLRSILFISIHGLLALSVHAQTVTVENVVAGQPDFLVTNNSFDVRKNLLMDVEYSSGKKVFVWQEFDAGSSVNKNVKCAVYNADMSVYAAPFILNTTTTGDQMSPVVRVNQQDNSFVVAWVSWINNSNPSDPNKYDIYAKKIRFNSITTDVLNNDLLINTNYTAGRQYGISLTYEYTFNELLVGWIDQDGQDRLPTIVASDNGSYARRINTAGNTLALISGANQFQIITSATVGHQSLNAFEVSPVTGELYTFSFSYNFPGGNSCDMIFRKFTRGTDGNYIAGTESIINTHLPGIQYAGSLIINSINGDYTLSWTSDSQDGSGYGTYFKVYNKYNTLLKAETRINQVAYGNQIAPKAIWNEASNDLIFYYWYSALPSADVRYQIFDGNNNYAYVGSEVISISKNLVDQYAGQFSIRYGQASHRIFLTYDEFSGSNTKGWFRQFVFESGVANPVADLDRNYVQTQTLLKSGVKFEEVIQDLDESSVTTSRDYVDGLGRASQQVVYKGSALKKDFVQPIVYDQYGRETKKYLPYAASTGNGGYKVNAVTDQAAFYNASGDRVVNDAYPFSVNTFEPSPLNRIAKVYPEGASWQTGTDHSVRNNWKTNTTNEVKKWVYNHTTDAADGSTFYNPGELYVTETIDENGNKSWEYKDKLNRVILEKEENVTNSEFLETYSIYDDMGNLRFVLPPSRSTMTSVIYNSTDANLFLFCYKYDARKRLVEKNVPGSDVQYYIYDKYNRLVLTQDGAQRISNKWTYNKYDAYNRMVMSGIYTHSSTLSQSDMQILVSGSTVWSESKQSSTVHGYSNVVWPTTNIDVLTVDYYDDYDFDYNGTADYSYSLQNIADEAPVSQLAKGLATGNKSKILGATDWIKSVYFYDKNKRLIQIKKNNQLNYSNLYDITTIIYDFSGKVVLTKESTDVGSGPLVITQRSEYDHAGRLIDTWHKINSNPEVLLTRNKYNEKGELVDKSLHSENSGNSFLQSLDYRYNIRGWQTGFNHLLLINDGVVNDDNNDLFCYQIQYEVAGALGNVPQYNGNVSCVFWSGANSSTSTMIRSYNYMYDGLDRLKDAILYDKVPNTEDDWVVGSFQEKNITYDKDGNITALSRSGSTAALIDNLTYNYSECRLYNILDAASASQGFVDGSVPAGPEYAYDANGNTITDNNKKISITYNHLNLPSQIDFFLVNNRIEYTYTALGERLRKKVFVNNVLQDTYDYIGGLIYRNGAIEQGQTDEGRFQWNSSAFSYEYDIKDYLGNVHMSFDKNASTGNARIIQEDHYYPFGMTMAASSMNYRFGDANDYLFQGQELQVENNLNLYLFDLRVYDPIIARWLQVDPFDEYSSSYLAMGNNPLKYIDPTGGETEGPQGPESNKDVDRSKNDEQSKAKPRERKGIIGLISSLIDPSWVKKSDGNYVKTLEHKGNLNQPSVTVNVENSITISQEQVPITDKTISYRAKYDPGNNTKELKMKVNSSYRMRDFEVSRGNENIYSNSNALREFDTPKIKHKRSKTYSISYKVRYLPYDNTGAAMGVVLLRTTLTVQRKIKINRALLQYSGMKKVGPISN